MAATMAPVSVSPFTIEADHPRNSELYVISVPGCRLRSAFNGNKGAIDVKTGYEQIPLDQISQYAGMPPLPGMQLTLFPGKLEYEITDPLFNNEPLCDRVLAWARNNIALAPSAKFNGVPPHRGELDMHRMKTAVREVLRILESGEARLVKGAKPSLDDVDQLPGRYLLEPSPIVQYQRPRYEADLEAWVERLQHSGG